MEIDNFLSKFNISDEDFIQFKPHFKPLSFKPGEDIIKQGEQSDSFYVISVGELMVINQDTNNNERLLDVLGPGKFFGEIGLLKNITR